MKSYLLNWNRKNFNTSDEGTKQGTLDYMPKEIVRWLLSQFYRLS
jgi:hypothetical protein